MKIPFLSLLGLLSLNCFADPFYTESDPSQTINIVEENPNTSDVLEQEIKPANCTGSEKSQPLHLDVAFSTLKLVGIVRFDQHFRALFTDSQDRLIDLKPHDLLSPENIEITDITLKQVHYIAWQNITDCHHPIISTLKF